MAETIKQNTIEKTATLSGKGLFTGSDCTLTIKPADANSGIVFRRTDMKSAEDIPATIDSVVQQERRTALIKGEASVQTVEHLMSAIHALALDNLLIELTGPEVPAMDGSALDFYNALLEAGVKAQDADADIYVLDETVMVEDKGAMIVASPSAGGLDILYDMDYTPHPFIGRQTLGFKMTTDDYATQIAPARTFILEKEAEYLRSQGFGKHLSETDLLVIGNEGPIGNELRFADECVRHKTCDLIGDLRLLGKRLQARITANRSGHALNQQLVAKLIERITKPKPTDEKAEKKEPAAKDKPDKESDKKSEAAQKPSDEKTATPQPEAKKKPAAAPAATPQAPVMDIRKILRILPHRYPFLMIDRVIELLPDEKAVGIKNVTFNEPFFQGHYPGQPVMPGVLVLEAMAQLSGILLSKSLDNTNKVALLISMDRVKIRQAARPGDQLVITAESRQVRTRTGFCKCKSTIAGKLSAEAEIKFMLVDEELT